MVRWFGFSSCVATDRGECVRVIIRVCWTDDEGGGWRGKKERKKERVKRITNKWTNEQMERMIMHEWKKERTNEGIKRVRKELNF